MDLGLQDKVVLVTGSSRGIGLSIAENFLTEGAMVVITGRNLDSLNKAIKILSSKYSCEKIFSYQGDLTCEDNIKICVDSIIERWGRIDILVANIGSGKSKPGVEVERDEWLRMLNINLLGAMDAVRVVVPVMRRLGGGSIVFTASIAGLEAIGAPVPYSVAKVGLIKACKDYSLILAEDNIRINAVAPGNIKFPGGRWEEIIADNPEIVDTYIKRAVPMKRFGTPEEIANIVVFLASERASFVTGACIVADGGQTLGY